MSDQNSINTVRKTFESSFDRGQFIYFVKNLLNEYESAEISRTGQYIPDAYSDYVSKYERIGKYKDSDKNRIDILIVYLKKETSIERARSMQRNFIAGYLRGNYGTNSDKDAALVAFVAPNGEDWRFSLVKLEVKLDADDEGKIKLVDEFTPAKRWSFLVGSHEKSHTAQRQFQPILEDIENNPTLEDLEGAFNIEKVTDEFFREYRRLFIEVKSALDKAVKANPKTKADFESKGIDTVNLAKKLLGQIIFLYYLQKKGWFGVPKDGKWGEGKKNFLRELFEKKHGDYEDFFNDVLEPLFYDALRMDRSDEDYYYKRFKCKIPFLNGGLFDPMGNYNWEKTVINLSNSLFSNKTKGNPEGDGILDVFDLYNFTVNEDEPFEKEVAIDPELLGKAYEKFNAIRPDNYDEFKEALKSGKGGENKFNKQYGVYYTPREIVHYMCQQSLINYLATELEDTVSKDDLATLIQQGENLREHEARAESNPSRKYQPIISEEIREHAVMVDNKLAAIKVCDPAVGSGAFPVGMMSEIVRARDVLRTWTKTKKTVYDFKRQCIENSLYGVDIDAGAVEIAKLRLWLSLIVDEVDIQNIKPLPNLDYKILCGNSLLSVNKDNLFVYHSLKQIENIKEELFNETNIQKKQQYKEQIDKLIEEVTDNNKAFDFEIYFSEVFEDKNQEKKGFDIVIANPPYIGQKMNNDIFRVVKASKLGFFHQRRMDFFYFFFHLGLNILREGGILSFITTNYYITATGADKLRKDLHNRSTILTLINFNELKIFESASGQHNLITILQKGHLNKLARTSITAKRGYLGAEILTKIVNGTDPQTMYYYISQDKLFDNGMIKLTSGGVDDVLDKVLAKSNKLNMICDISTGIQTGAHKLSEAHINKYGDFGNIGDGIFVLSKDELVNKNIPKSDQNVKPWFKNSDIKKYITNLENEEYLLYVLSHQVSKEITKHFEEYKLILINRNIESGVQVSMADYDAFVRNKKKLKYVMQHSSFKQGFYFNISYPRKQSVFEGEKIVSSQWAKSNTFGWNNIPWYGGTDLCVITLKNHTDTKFSLKTILGILNSKIIYDWLYFRGKRKGELLELTVTPLSNIPIPILDTPPMMAIVDQINNLVERILAAKGGNPQADTSALEREIDQLVYELYGLTEDEVKIVEGRE